MAEHIIIKSVEWMPLRPNHLTLVSWTFFLTSPKLISFRSQTPTTSYMNNKNGNFTILFLSELFEGYFKIGILLKVGNLRKLNKNK